MFDDDVYLDDEGFDDDLASPDRSSSRSFPPRKEGTPTRCFAHSLSTGVPEQIHLGRIDPKTGRASLPEGSVFQDFFEARPWTHDRVSTRRNSLVFDNPSFRLDRILAERLERPTFSPEEIETAHKRTAFAASLSREQREELKSLLDEFYARCDLLTFHTQKLHFWHEHKDWTGTELAIQGRQFVEYCLLNGPDGEQRYYYRDLEAHGAKAVLALGSALAHIDAMKEWLEGNGLREAFSLLSDIDSVLNHKSLEPLRNYFRKYPLSEEDNSLIGRKKTAWQSKSDFWKGFAQADERNHRFRPSIREEKLPIFSADPETKVKLDEFRAIWSGFLEEPAHAHQLRNLPLVLVKGCKELEHALAAARMLDTGHYCIPEVCREPGRIEVKGAWNPLVCAFENFDRFDISVGSEHNCVGISGPNEGGKSTYLETAALIVLCNQMNLPVPAAAAELSPFLRLFMVSPDFAEPSEGESQHTLFIRQLRDIASTAGPGDAVFIDEANIGSERADLIALTKVLVEDIAKTGAALFYATHLREVISELVESLPGFEPVRMELEQDSSGNLHRHPAPGIAASSMMISTLLRVGFPEAFCELTGRIHDAITGGEPLTDGEVLPLLDRMEFPKDLPYDNGEDSQLLKETLDRQYPDSLFVFGKRHKGPLIPEAVSYLQGLGVDALRSWQASLAPRISPANRNLQSKNEIVEALNETRGEIIDSLALLRDNLDGLRERGILRADEAWRELTSVCKDLPNSMPAFVEDKPYEFKARSWSVLQKVFDFGQDVTSGDYLRCHAQLEAVFCTETIEKLRKIGLEEIDTVLGIAIADRVDERTQAIEASPGSGMKVHDARSPFLENPVPLSLEFDGPNTQMVILGPNGSGKSTVIRTLQNLALQADAKYSVSGKAILPRFEKVLTLWGGKEEPAEARSYFNWLSRKVLGIMAAAGPNTFAVMDELRGSDYFETSAFEGAIALVMSHLGATFLTNTHHREGLRAVSHLAPLRFYKMDVELDENGKMKFLYTLSPDPGLTSRSYGIECLRDVLPPDQYEGARALRGKYYSEV